MHDGRGYQVMPGEIAVGGVGVGTVTRDSGTGVTVLTLPPGALGGVAVSGGAPATRETALLRPENLVPGPDAIFLSGGSAFGLRVADGIMEALVRADRGMAVGALRVPIVVGACLFDLDPACPDPPTAADGQQAALLALGGGRGEEGLRGAGAGASVGKWLGRARAMGGGQAMVSLRTPDGLAVGALVAVNAVGSVRGEDGTWLAGPRGDDGEPLDSTELMIRHPRGAEPGGHTTIGAVVTNAALSKAQLSRVALMAQDGVARAIDPAHTHWDGDTIFAAATGEGPYDADLVGVLAARAVSLAIRRAVRLANGL
jgi:L-aminopeptidase/D-esterase-like protein